jgi:hypothetical protein
LEQWQAINAILFNGNGDPHEFLLCHESANTTERYNKAKRADRGWHVQQSYLTIAGAVKQPSGIGYYPWNGDRQSYWGALDVDAHEGQSSKRARELAARAVTLLSSNSLTLGVIACTSGSSGGWHVFMFRPLPRPIAEWTEFLCKLRERIGATESECELHPIETDERPRGIRVPGSLNPKDGSFGLIAFDTVTDRLDEWRELVPRGKKGGGSFSKTVIIVLGELALRELCSRYAIRTARSRNTRLVQMVGYAVTQCGHELALKAAAELLKQARPACNTPMKEHLADFARAWMNITKKEVAKLSRAERREYMTCKTDTERSAFLIIRNWLKGGGGYVHRNHLAARLGVSGEYAGKIRREFCARGIIRMTADYVIHKWARRYKWML